jgi:hypothetical protein
MGFASKILNKPIFYGLLYSFLLNIVIGPLCLLLAIIQFNLDLDVFHDWIFVLCPSVILLFLFKYSGHRLVNIVINQNFYYFYFFVFILKLFFFTVFGVSGFTGVVLFILSNLFYPLTMILITQKGLRVTLLFVFVSVLSVYISPWRSTSLFFMMLSVLHLENRVKLKGTNIIKLLTLVFIFLFLFLQKSSEKFSVSINDSAVALFYNLGIRSNFIRENSYASTAMKYGDQKKLDGYSYEEAILEIVPSFIYKKSSGNGEFLGREVARNIGLVNELDENTSWSVNYLTEYYLNYGYDFLNIIKLLLFFTFFFGIFNYLSFTLRRHNRMFYSSILFVSFFEIVNLTVFLSNVFYSYILILIFDKMRFNLFKITKKT